MTSSIDVSVVIPSRNRAHTLPRCIDSVLAQTVPPSEIIVVDDASTDDTREVVGRYRDPRVIYAKLPAGAGAQAARNHGVNVARYDWIAFQDSDDLWLPQKLALQLQALETRNFDTMVAVHGDGVIRDEGTGLERPLEAPLTAGRCYRQLLLRPSVMFPALLASKAAIIESGGMDNECPSFQEWDTAIRLARKCEFLHVRSPLFVWSWHAGEAISKDRGRHVAGFNYVICKHRDEIVSNYGTGRWRRLCLQNVADAIGHGNFEGARAMLKDVPSHSSGWMANVFARMGRVPVGGRSLLRYAAMLPF